jgi:serine/threonine protein kinase
MAQAPSQRSHGTPTRLGGVIDRAPPVAPAGAADPRIGATLAGRYRIQRKLGEGGMANVYLAEDAGAAHMVAIKVLHDESVDQQEVVERFLQEARAASVIGHPNVVEISDFGRSDSGEVYLVMELLVGEDLADMLDREGALPWSRVRPMLLQICGALAAAHAKGIIHRDIKPENLFRLDRDGDADFIKILDFGIAKITATATMSARALTQTGSIFGTPEYMSPEQAEGRKVDPRTDIYSLGVIAYRLLTGRVPFDGESPTVILVKHMVDPPPVPSRTAPARGLTPCVDALILKALEKDPAKRFQTMEELAAAIASIDDSMQQRAPPQQRPAEGARPPRPAGRVIVIILIVAVLLSLAAVLALIFWPPPPPTPPTPPPVLIEEPPPPPPEPPAPPPPITLRIHSAQPAEIWRDDPRELLGRTDDPDGLKLERGQAPLRLLLIAEGFEDHPFELTPAEDLERSYELLKKKRTKGSKRAKTPPP